MLSLPMSLQMIYAETQRLPPAPHAVGIPTTARLEEKKGGGNAPPLFPFRQSLQCALPTLLAVRIGCFV